MVKMEKEFIDFDRKFTGESFYHSMEEENIK